MAPRHRDAPEVHHLAADSLRVDSLVGRRRVGCRLRPRRVVAVPPARRLVVPVRRRRVVAVRRVPRRVVRARRPDVRQALPRWRVTSRAPAGARRDLRRRTVARPAAAAVVNRRRVERRRL
ncbi:hypothetical protein [Rhodococcus sp. ACPA1]|uniref:hypothetical protein n=1 Tax=Rhodococcus sp. ACPA1 TaxID=2028572 RepID=UPI00211C5FFD|nr:hypothetical protein [Rhodococcus sp. ACPA1]